MHALRMTTYRAGYRTTTPYAPFAWSEDAPAPRGDVRAQRRSRPGRRSGREGASAVDVAAPAGADERFETTGDVGLPDKFWLIDTRLREKDRISVRVSRGG